MSSSSSYKQATLKSHQPENYRVEAQQLQEAFPSWSNDDLQSLLSEVGGDIQLAATRISEGYAEQWGSVNRKKDKKSPPVPQSKDSPSQRGEFRGARGGRGGRGGSGRGGSAARPRGTPRGTNGHLPRSTNTPLSSPAPTWADVIQSQAGSDEPSASGDWSNKQDSQSAFTSTWGDPTPSDTPATASWGTSTASSTWGATPDQNGSPSSTPKLPVPQAKPAKNPATSKLSWAEIARPQEKPAPPSSASAPAPPSPAPTSPSLGAPPQPEPEPEPNSELQHQGWEDPTTIQPHTWDDEPSQAKSITSNAWLSSAENPERPEAVQEQEIKEPPAPEPAPEPVPPGLPSQLQTPPQDLKPELPSSSKPIPPVAQVRAPTSSHRNSARYKTIDQPVVMPSSFATGIEKVGMQFGSLSLGGESLFDTGPPEPPAETPPRAPETALPEQVQAPHPPTQAHNEPPPVSAPTAQTPHNHATGLFQQPQPPPQHISHPQNPLQPSVSQPSVPVQPQAQAHAAATASPAQQFAQQSVSQQQALATHNIQQQQHQQQQQPQPQPQQPQQQPQHQPPSQSQVQSQYAQHGLPTHIDPTQNQAPHSPQTIPPASQSQPQQSANAHSTYFRQADAPYFHAPTPPAPQSQDSPYGAFGSLAQQGQHQAQASHIGGFGGGEYGYGDNQRGFYESYAQQSGFGNRNVLGHDDVKSLPAQQQPPASAGLPPSTAQSSQQHPPAAPPAGQPQPGAGQGPQQGYPPVPYYYNPYSQNQFYGSPYNSAYGVPQPFVKYPAMFQPGPPGPGSAPSPAVKQAPNVQPQSNPYNQGLYAQHPSASYDEIGYQHHAQQHQQHNLTQGVAANLPSTEYAKQHPLYGGHNAQGMQGFMGLGQNTGPSSGPPIGQRTGGSPETPYKPYAPNVGVKDVGAGVGVGQPGVGQGPQGRAGVQPQPQHNQGAFYGTNRFASSAAGGPQGQQAQQHQNQGQAPQGHIGYPQGGNDGNFYSYQPRQQGYWQ